MKGRPPSPGDAARAFLDGLGVALRGNLTAEQLAALEGWAEHVQAADERATAYQRQTTEALATLHEYDERLTTALDVIASVRRAMAGAEGDETAQQLRARVAIVAGALAAWDGML